MNTHIKSLTGKKVRIKREFITTEDSEYGNYYVEGNMALSANIDNPLDAIFKVLTDVYGVDLWPYTFFPTGHNEQDAKHVGFEIGSVEPTHQVIIEAVQGCNDIRYPFLWDAKYFEEVREETIITKIYHPVKVG